MRNQDRLELGRERDPVGHDAAPDLVAYLLELVLRLPAVEHALTGRAPTAAVLAEAGALAAAGANPLPMTVYKGRLLVGAVVEALERASGVTNP